MASKNLITVTVDDGDGRTLTMGCLDCKRSVLARLDIAYPAVPLRRSLISVYCDRCSEQLAPAFDAFTFEVVEGQRPLVQREVDRAIRQVRRVS